MPQTTIYVAPRPAGPAGTPPAVSAEGLARLYGHRAALAGVSLEVAVGATLAVLGPNGAGKTTLLRLLATAIRPSFGRLAIDGIDALAHPDLVRTRVAYLPHATGLYDDLTAAENLAFAVAMHGRRGAEAAERVLLLLDEVGLAGVARDTVRTFSAGMRKRLALARLLAGAPSVVLLDEPHAALDAEAIAVVDRLIGRWREAGMTLLIASHQVDRVTSLADGTLRLDGGVVAEARGLGIRVPAHRPDGAPSPALVA